MTTTAKEPRLAGLSGFLQALQDEFDARYWPLAGQFLAAAELFGRRAEIRPDGSVTAPPNVWNP
jgi:hypothetical protein